jgi:hypothetical protein
MRLVRSVLQLATPALGKRGGTHIFGVMPSVVCLAELITTNGPTRYTSRWKKAIAFWCGDPGSSHSRVLRSGLLASAAPSHKS